ncbi:hypothetical protein ALC56_04882 [Trachymyrmex septentrionalis]|uniref:Ig-like domain-containing protein n=1 Tax=Trachymyrmex septentrionalis TaxID=34720 RepID=A0A195FJJ5_9HYME|nr:PREDICTED: uncharacterized protein LOC108747367 [Trachymyrmex septentrionalis]KYN40573.1 hypothetical protein ALC56_04882 [Trachymyrmex septentrionalis]
MPSISRTVSPSLIVLLIFEYYSGVRGSSIKSLDVPMAVRNGTGPVDLTCAYQIDENENGLVIKWFHEAYQIYQWIPPIPPQDIGIIEGIAEYPAENLKNPYSCSMIRLKTVTINMTGEYTCTISTYQDEASNSTKMIVYVPESNMTVRTYPFNKTHVNLICVVMGALPRPSLKLYVNGIESNSCESDLGPLTDWYKGNPQTSLNVIIENTLDPAIIECEMSIPETEYKRRERIVYYPTQLLPYRTNVSQGRHYAMLLVDILCIAILRLIW